MIKIRFKLEQEYVEAVIRMAKEAGVDPDGIAKIALYNLIALWMRERGMVDHSLVSDTSYDSHYVGRVDVDDVGPEVLK